MIFSMTDEVTIFLYACLTGGCIMLIYDILSLAGTKEKNAIFLINVCDGIFIAICCTIMVFMTFTISNGIVRAFEFFGVFLGAILYKITLSRWILFLLKQITRFILSFFQLFFKILLTPLAIMYKMIYRCMRALCLPACRIVKRMAKHLSFRFHTSVQITRKAMKKL